MIPRYHEPGMKGREWRTVWECPRLRLRLSTGRYPRNTQEDGIGIDFEHLDNDRKPWLHHILNPLHSERDLADLHGHIPEELIDALGDDCLHELGQWAEREFREAQAEEHLASQAAKSRM